MTITEDSLQVTPEDEELCDLLRKRDREWFAANPRAIYRIRKMHFAEGKKLIKTPIGHVLMRCLGELREVLYDGYPADYTYTVIKMPSRTDLHVPSLRVYTDRGEKDVFVTPMVIDWKQVFTEITPLEYINELKKELEWEETSVCDRCREVVTPQGIYWRCGEQVFCCGCMKAHIELGPVKEIDLMVRISKITQLCTTSILAEAALSTIDTFLEADIPPIQVLVI